MAAARGGVCKGESRLLWMELAGMLRLLSVPEPPRTAGWLPAWLQIVSSFLPVGPLAMSALALLNLGTAASRPGVEAQSTEMLLHFAQAFEHSGIMAALFLWGAATWWLVVAVLSVGSTLRELPFNMGW